MARKELMRSFGVDAIYGLDFETYYDDTLSLRKMATTEYVTHPDMEVQLVAVQKDSWSKAKVMTASEFKTFARTVDWSRAAILAHHAHFDGLLASHFFGVKSKAYVDTLSMARPVMPVQVGGSLAKLCAAFGLAGKRGAEALVQVKGKRFKEFTKQEIADLKYYAGGDIEQTWLLLDKLLPFIPENEMHVISTTVKMYAQPRLLIDKAMTEQVIAEEQEKKSAKLDAAGAQRAELMSNEQFAALLRDRTGIEPPTKISKRTGKVALALSKNDLEFKALLKHSDPTVVALVEARLAVKSTSAETRAERMSFRAALGAQPIYLNYWGAKTGRWSGGDKANWQNLQRGSALRKSLTAPNGHQLIIADQAQIEARLNAWFHEQADVVQAFADKIDVYKLAASRIYGIPYDLVDKGQRFVGKVAVLALGYGAGSARFADMLRLGSFGQAVNISDADAKTVVDAWRRANSRIVAGWRKAMNNARMAFVNKISVDDRVITYQGYDGKGVTHLPGGLYIRYDGVEFDGEEMTYISNFRRLADGTVNYDRTKLYGGLLVENDIQALGRQIIAENILDTLDALPSAQLVMTTHDEVVYCVPNKHAKKALATVREIMTTPPAWAPDIPLGVDAHASGRYDK